MTRDLVSSLPSMAEAFLRDEARLNKAAMACGGAAVALGTTGLLGMFLGIELLSAVIPGYKTMSVLAGIAWILLGSCIITRAACRRLMTIQSLVLGALAVTGAMEFPLNLTGSHFIADNILYAAGAVATGQQASHISLVSTMVMVLAATALFTLNFSLDDTPKSLTGKNIGGCLALLLLIIGLTFGMSYLYGTPFLLGTAIVPVSLLSVLAILVTGTGILLLTGPRAFPLRYFSGSDTRAKLMRTFIPLVFIIILVQNLLQTVFFEESAIPEAIMTAAWFVLFTIAIGYAVGRVASSAGRTIDEARQEQERAEEALRETNAYLSNLINHANAPIIVWDPQFRITRFNQAFEHLTGRTEAEVIGQPLEILFPYESQDASLGKIGRTLSGERWDTVEIPILDIDGGIRTVLWNSANVLGSDGNIISTIAQGTDITDRIKAENELKQSEERYRNVVEDQEEFICRFTPQGIHIFVNDAYCRYFGKSRDEILGHVFRPRIHPDDAERVRQYFTALTPDHPVAMIEERIIMPDGTVRWQRWSNRAIFDNNGRLTEIQSVGRDITLQKEAEIALNESRQIFADIIEFLPDATFAINAKGEVIAWNHAMEVMTGVEKADMLNKGNFEYSLPLYRKRRPILIDLVFGHDEMVMKKYRVVKREGNRLTAEIYTPHLNNGKGAYLWFIASPLYGPQGNITGAIESIRDITTWRRSETELAANERRLRMLFENMTEAVALHEIILDTDGKPVDYRFLSANPAFERMTGLNAGELIGRTVREVLPGIEQSWIDRYGDVALTGRAIMFEDYNSDTKRHYNVTAYSPTNLQFACIFSDITEKQLADKQRETLIGELEKKNAELERFTYTVSHDLKSPLITIHGFLGMLEQNLEKGDMPKVRRNIDRISSATEKMQELLSDLLELSRIGRFANPSVRISSSKIVQDAIEMLSGTLGARGVEVDVAPDMPDVCVDPVRIREAFINLIENSVKFSGEGQTPRISIGVDRRSDQPVFFVRDNGMGIEPDYHQKVFGLFEKLDPRSNGTGIGLAIVHRIIEVHGGRIWIESEGPGRGTTVFFTLPVAGSTCLYNPDDRPESTE